MFIPWCPTYYAYLQQRSPLFSRSFSKLELSLSVSDATNLEWLGFMDLDELYLVRHPAYYAGYIQRFVQESKYG